jgi:asparagine synthase (glutamine-hydrolysing)
MLELALKIPTRYRAHDEVTKVALRSAAIKQLPERTANKKKLGFPVPLNDWLREDKYYEKVKKAFLSLGGIIPASISLRSFKEALSEV